MDMNVTKRIGIHLTLLALSLLTAHAMPNGGGAPEVPPAAIQGFQKNVGQIRNTDGTACPNVLYTALRGNMRVYLTTTGLSYVFEEREKKSAEAGNCTEHAPDDPCVERISFAVTSQVFRTDVVFEGASQTFTLSEENPGTARVRYILGKGAAPVEGSSFERIVYRNVYPGIDARFTMTEAGLKYEFVVHPGAEYRDIKLRVEGADDIALLPNGALEFQTPLGTIREQAPESFEQLTEQHLHAMQPAQSLVPSSFRLQSGAVSFNVQRSAPDAVLVIDPYVQWSTYLGGAEVDAGNASDFLPNGDIVVGGFTSSANFPTTPGVLQEVHNNIRDGFLARYASGGTLIWATYLGGDIDDIVMSLDVDVNGDIVAGGYTTSSNFPTTSGAFQENIAGGLDVFLAKVSPDGNLIWATLFGGSGGDNCEGLATDSQGNIAFTGFTHSSNLPRTASAYQLVYAGNRDAYVAKFRSDGSRMWATYYGGDVEDWGHSVSIDGDDNIYAVGHSHSYNFPTTAGSFQPNQRGYRDGFLLKFAPDGTREWATLIGADDWDDTYDVDTDPTGHVAVAGATVSARFPVTPGAIQPTHARYYDGIVMRFQDDGNLQWSTFIGMGGWEMFHSVATYPSGNMMIAGFAESTTMYALPQAFQIYHGGGEYDMYVMKITADGSRRYGTYLGGAGEEYENASTGLMSIAVNRKGEAVLTGRTSSDNFPTLLPAQSTFGGVWDATVTKWTCSVTPQPFIVASGPLTFCEGDSVSLEIPEGYHRYVWSTGDTTRSITVKAAGTYIASVGDDDDCFADTNPVTIQVNPIPQPFISPGGPIHLCEGDSVVLDAGSGYAGYAWSNGETGRYVTISSTDTLDVTVSDGTGCTGLSQRVAVIVHELPQPAIAPMGPTAFCEGETVELDAGAGFTSYAWSTGDTTQIIEVSTSGTYSVRVTNTYGCEAVSADIEVTVFPLPQPLVLPQGPTSFCIGDSVVLDAGAGYSTYQWSSGETTQRITVFDAGSYKVTVTSADGCTDSSNAIVVETHPLPEPEITALGPLEFCELEATVLDAGPGYSSYQWSTGDTTQTIEAKQTGSYTVTVSSGEGCTAVSDPVNVVVHMAPTPDIAPAGTISFCEGDSAVLSAQGQYAAYLWSTGSDERSIVVTQPGIYSLTVVDSNGCEGISNVVTVNVYPNPPKPVIAQSRDTLFASPAAASYVWYRDGSVLPGSTDAVLVVPGAGVYTVEALSVEGCATLSDPFDVVIASITVSLPDIILQPGERATIPLTVENSNLMVESGAQTFSATISFDKNTLADIAPANGWTIDAASRRLQIAGGWDPLTRELGVFEVMALLGPVKTTDLVIEDFQWMEGIVATTTVNGSVTLDICEEGGDRLFDGSGQVQMAQNSPNPFNGQTVLRYELIERGHTQVYVTDLLGRRVATLVSGEAQPGVYEVRFDAGSLPTGRYFAVLQTPTVTRVRIMQLVK